jgi:hypothetical protein
MPPTRRVKGNIEGASAPQEKEAGLKSKQLGVCLAYGIILTERRSQRRGIEARSALLERALESPTSTRESTYSAYQRVTVCLRNGNLSSLRITIEDNAWDNVERG